jgi:hypothetical protein
MSNELTVYKNNNPEKFLDVFYENIFNNFINYYYKKNNLFIKLLGVYLFRKMLLYFI